MNQAMFKSQTELINLSLFEQMSIDFAAGQIFSGDLEDAPLKISDMFRDLVEGLMSFPINIPGTSHHKCLQVLFCF